MGNNIDIWGEGGCSMYKGLNNLSIYGITTIDILNMTEHGLHPGCVPGTYQAILISRAPTHINARNCAQNYPQNARKTLAKTRKRPQIQESGKL